MELCKTEKYPLLPEFIQAWGGKRKSTVWFRVVLSFEESHSFRFDGDLILEILRF